MNVWCSAQLVYDFSKRHHREGEETEDKKVLLEENR